MSYNHCSIFAVCCFPYPNRSYAVRPTYDIWTGFI